MAAAPIGAVVKIYVDTPVPIEVGAVITTPTSRAYVVLAVRRQVTGKRRGRQHLQVLVADPTDLPEGGQRFLLRWYRRKAKNDARAPLPANRRAG